MRRCARAGGPESIQAALPPLVPRLQPLRRFHLKQAISIESNGRTDKFDHRFKAYTQYNQPLNNTFAWLKETSTDKHYVKLISFSTGDNSGN